MKIGAAELVNLGVTPDGAQVVAIKTDHQRIEISISAKGNSIRIWRNGTLLPES